MGIVGLAKTGRGIKTGLADSLRAIGGIERFIARGDRVLLKPNLNGVEGCTNIELADALIGMISDAGAGRISIGEATFGDARTTDMLFKKTGYAELARKYGIPLHNLNASQAVEVEVKEPLVAKTLRIAREAIEADAIVNIPVMKVHYATGITLALKNMKGVLVGDQKRRFHEIGLDKAIVDLNNTIRPRLNVIDATTCMERMGPRGGDAVTLDLVIAGSEAAETDWVGARVMGYGLSEVRHLRYFMEFNRIDAGNIEFAGESLESVARPFRKVDVENLVPDALTVLQTDACSSCMNAFLLSCGFLERPPEERIDIFMGSTLTERHGEPAASLAFGTCGCSLPRAFDAMIRGCPPYPFALKEWIASNRSGGA